MNIIGTAVFVKIAWKNGQKKMRCIYENKFKGFGLTKGGNNNEFI